MLTALRKAPAAVGIGNALRASPLATNVSRFRPSWYGISSRCQRSSIASRLIHISSSRCAVAGAATRVQRDFVDSDIDQSGNASRTSSRSDAHHGSSGGPITEFQELADQGLVQNEIVKAITGDMRLSTMTPVQSLTITETLKGLDVSVPPPT